MRQGWWRPPEHPSITTMLVRKKPFGKRRHARIVRHVPKTR